MNRSTLVLILAVMLMPPSGHSQPLSVTLGGGLAPAVGSLGHATELGYHGNLSLGFLPDQMNSPELELRLRLAYQFFPSDQANDISIAAASLEIKLDHVLAREPNMYLIGGGGLARIDYGVVETSPFGTIGFGVEKGQLVIESRLVRTTGNQIHETTFFPVTIGFRF